MIIKKKALDGVNEITEDTETDVTTTTLVYTHKSGICLSGEITDLTTGKIIVNNIEITSVEDWEKVKKSLVDLQQENQSLKKANKILRENAEHNDKVVDKYWWKNKHYKHITDELEKWLEENWQQSQDIWFVKIINKLQELKGNDKE